jgi:hypothetical protein
VHGTNTLLFSDRILECLKEPGEADGSGLVLQPDGLRGVKSGRLYPFVEGVPSLFVSQGGPGRAGNFDHKGLL